MLSFLTKTFSGKDTTPKGDAELRKDFLEAYEGVKKKSFPDVTDISGEELKALDKESYVLVDCRDPNEQEVSMLPGAITMAEFEKNLDQYKDKDVVAHCAIGGRSGKFCKRMAEQHPELKVKNYAGSIIDWAHVNGDLVDPSGQPTKKFHAAGKSWIKYAPKENGYEAVV